MITGKHILHAFDEELKTLGNLIARMSSNAESQFREAMLAVDKRDAALAERVVAGDEQINALEQQIENMAISMIAKRQPMADDLRYIIACLKTAHDIERLGDYAKNIARRAVPMSKYSLPETLLAPTLEISGLVADMLKNVFEALASNDARKAIAVWESDDAVDNRYGSLVKAIRVHMAQEPESVKPLTHLLFIAKNVERIGDMATNLSETIHYRVTGTALAETYQRRAQERQAG